IVDGRYRLDAVLGIGGMGIVYKATHLGLDKTFAVKVLRTEFTKVSGAIERFKVEARAVNHIKNPHIIEVTDYGTLPDGAGYFVMEYLDGKPLSHLIEKEKRPLSYTRMIRIFSQFAEGLAAAHRAKVVHRDLKPDNIFLIQKGNERDYVKILDFGIAKVADGAKLTMAGALLGTPDYMSPQQASGMSLDGRSDIYSFGVIFYEALSGITPFDGDDPHEILKQHLETAPTPLHQVPDSANIPPELEAIVMKCLEKDLKNRYQTMEEVIEDLQKIASNPSELSEQEIEASEAATLVLASRKKISSATAAKVGVLTLFVGAAALATRSYLLSKDSKNEIDSSVIPQPSASSSARIKPSLLSSKTVELFIEPADAHVFLDGKDLGANPKIEVEEGATLNLEIRKKGYQSKKIELDDSQDKVAIRLDPDKTHSPKKPRTPSHPTVGGDFDKPWK
ncbi:MAG: serine/threonine protein kinase, partial [Deltaproteobacteria bacterium]|nr:serine/threonine protein kinase [Deltaproteobacteria bacterium]